MVKQFCREASRNMLRTHACMEIIKANSIMFQYNDKINTVFKCILILKNKETACEPDKWYKCMEKIMGETRGKEVHELSGKKHYNLKNYL